MSARPCIYIDAAVDSGDEIRSYYELPDTFVREVWRIGAGSEPSPNETLSFDQALAMVFDRLGGFA